MSLPKSQYQFRMVLGVPRGTCRDSRKQLHKVMVTTAITPAINPTSDKMPFIPAYTGRYADEQMRLFKSAQALFGFTPQQADKFAKHAAQDAAILLKDARASIKVGKGDKDNKGTIADAASAKKVSLTNSLNLVHTIGHIDEIGKHGISYGHTKWVLVEALQNYAADLLD